MYYANTGLGVGVDPNGTAALVGEPGYVATFDTTIAKFGD